MFTDLVLKLKYLVSISSSSSFLPLPPSLLTDATFFLCVKLHRIPGWCRQEVTSESHLVWCHCSLKQDHSTAGCQGPWVLKIPMHGDTTISLGINTQSPSQLKVTFPFNTDTERIFNWGVKVKRWELLCFCLAFWHTVQRLPKAMCLSF